MVGTPTDGQEEFVLNSQHLVEYPFINFLVFVDVWLVLFDVFVDVQLGAKLHLDFEQLDFHRFMFPMKMC